jgi:two-component sensor histidine kinase
MLRTGVLSPDVTVNLAHAIVLASATPLLLLGADATVIAASRSFCRSFGIDPAQAALSPLSLLGHGEWDVPQLDALLLATALGLAPGEDCEFDLQRQDHPVQRLLLTAQTLNYPSNEGPMVLLSITDVTEARRLDHQKDGLVKEKSVLLQELQHRVANSLQIIASMMRQSARAASSEEARSSIQEAYHRVMSVVALQHLLVASQLGEVDLRQYLLSVCRSISTSMIHNPSVLTIEVNVAQCFVKADVSLSLGLIVTELVINALKHAYPPGRGGRIVIGYIAVGESWTLTVGDDGVGMQAKSDQAKAGLGSSIVTALAAQLDAAIVVSAANPGTLVSISHEAKNSARAQPVLAAV